mmetsp:Transcript_928/g.2876  ORF Transcript_928/g.2876 Transcript_928/m.2876 type:complete len:534 (-) Transcript_928:573-2174(-)
MRSRHLSRPHAQVPLRRELAAEAVAVLLVIPKVVVDVPWREGLPELRGHVLGDAAPEHGRLVDAVGKRLVLSRVVQPADDVHGGGEVQHLGRMPLQALDHLGLGRALRQGHASAVLVHGDRRVVHKVHGGHVPLPNRGLHLGVLQKGGGPVIDILGFEVGHVEHVVQGGHKGAKLAVPGPGAVHRVPGVVEEHGEVGHHEGAPQGVCHEERAPQLAHLVVHERHVRERAVHVRVLQVPARLVALHRRRVVHPGRELEGRHGEQPARGLEVVVPVQEPEVRVAEALALAVEALVHLVGGVHRDDGQIIPLGQALHEEDVSAGEEVHGQEAHGHRAVVAVGQLLVLRVGLAPGQLADEAHKECLHGLGHVRVGDLRPVVHHALRVPRGPHEHDAHVEVRPLLGVDLVGVLQAVLHGEGLLADQEVRGDEHPGVGVLEQEGHGVPDEGHVPVGEEHVEAQLHDPLDEADLVTVCRVPRGALAHLPERHRGDALRLREPEGLRVHGPDKEVGDPVGLQGFRPVPTPDHVLLVHRGRD